MIAHTAAWPHTRTPHWVAVTLALAAHIAVFYAWLNAPHRTTSTPSDPSVAAPMDVRIIARQVTQPTPAPPPEPVQADPPKPVAQPKRPHQTPSQPIEPPPTPPTVEPHTPTVALPESTVAPPLPAPAHTAQATATEPSSAPPEPHPPASAPDTAAVPSAESAWVICPGYQQAIRASPPPRQALRARMGGEVLVEFTVQPDGSIQNPQVITSTNHQLNRWALRTVEHAMRCIGQNKPIRLRLPIKLTFDTP